MISNCFHQSSVFKSTAFDINSENILSQFSITMSIKYWHKHQHNCTNTTLILPRSSVVNIYWTEPQTSTHSGLCCYCWLQVCGIIPRAVIRIIGIVILVRSHAWKSLINKTTFDKQACQSTALLSGYILC